MSIPTYTQLRRLVSDAAGDLEHPTKTDGEGNALSLRGRVVYIEGGHVAVSLDGVYLVAEGADHEDSIWALARRVDGSVPDNGVAVTEVSAEDFKQRITGK